MKKVKAFSLLETILSMSILGLICSSLITLYFFISTNKKYKINEQKFHYIRVAIQNYLLQHAKLPTASENDLGISSDKLIAGYIPYRTLGIAKSYMYDANNRPFKYVVNKLFIDTNIPIHTPLTYKPQKNEKSFLRLYNYHNNTLYYDYFANENELTILDKNNQSIIDFNDYFFVLTPLLAPFKTVKEFEKWVAENSKNQKEEYKITNLIAWLIISFGKNEGSKEHKQNKESTIIFFAESKNKSFSDSVFFQLRFDLASQIGFYSTPEPIYETKED